MRVHQTSCIISVPSATLLALFFCAPSLPPVLEQVAFNGMDLDFVSHNVLFTFVKQSWQGRRYIGLTCNEDERAISLRNPLFGYRCDTSQGLVIKGLTKNCLPGAMRGAASWA